MKSEIITALTADIVSAHISHNDVGAAEVSKLIQTVYTALASVGAAAPVPAEKLIPAVSVRASLKPDVITCLECGVRMKMLKRHLSTHHQLSPAEYRARWGLGADYPMVTVEYAARRKELAIGIGLGRKPGTLRNAEPLREAGSRRKPGRPKKSPATA